MEENKAKPKCSQPPSPLPSWGQDQALSGHLVGAVGGSAWPQSGTEEKEGPLVITEEKNPDVDDEPSQWGDLRAQEPRLYGAGSHQELHQGKVAVRVPWGDVAQQHLYQWQQRVTVKELPQGEKEVSDLKLSQQGEGSANSQEKQTHSPAPSEEMPSAGVQSSGPAPHSTCCSPSLPGAQSPSEQQAVAEGRSLLAEEGSEEGTPAEYDEDWEQYTQSESSQECQAEPELSQEEVSSCQDWYDSEECSELGHGDFLDGDSSSLDDSTEEDNSSTQDSYEYVSILSFGITPLPQEEDSLDKVSVLELCEAESRAQSLAALAADGLPVPVPREAWLEVQAPESLRASLSSLHGQASMAQQGPEAGPQSLGPALHSLEVPEALRQQPSPSSKRPGFLRRARRALRALFRWPCWAPQPQE